MTGSRIAIALLLPFAVFAILYALAVRPQLAVADRARQRLAQVQANVNRARLSKPPDTSTMAPAKLIENLLSSSGVGGVEHLSITSRPGEFDVSFDARHGQIGRFFWTLSTLPVTFDVRSVELTPAKAGLVHANIQLIYEGNRAAVVSTAGALETEPHWRRNPFMAVD